MEKKSRRNISILQMLLGTGGEIGAQIFGYGSGCMKEHSYGGLLTDPPQQWGCRALQCCQRLHQAGKHRDEEVLKD